VVFSLFDFEGNAENNINSYLYFFNKKSRKQEENVKSSSISTEKEK